uniref:G_PROTEIN_RECEP_F1_2 domain-containing protein n=1 Tax=Heterorhabditis bacteriophora TaxID=37862 RepID=A0A1I7XQ87_HETBA
MNMSEEVEECGFFEGYTLQRFLIITAFSVISAFGVIANALLMAVFWRTLPSSIYLAALGTMDMLICLTYLLLFGVDAGFVYLKDTTLFFLYHCYIVPIFFIAKVVQFAIPFILILITLERYLWTTREKTRSSRSKRSQLRNAIYTMFAIVMSYLVCNGVHLFLTFLERADSSLLYDSDDQNQSSNFYIALSDTVSICYMVSSAIRILIYAKCNPKLRAEISDYLRNTKDNLTEAET